MKSILRLFWTLLILCISFCKVALAQTITTGAVTPSTICEGGTITIPFTTSGTLATGTTFKAQIATSATSTFADIAGATATASPISAVVAANPGSGYRIRVVGVPSSSTATITGSVSTTSLTIVDTPVAPTVQAVTYCQNATASALTATASTGATLKWYSNATGGTVLAGAPTPTTTSIGTTTYYVSQAIGTCESPRAALTVTVTTGNVPAPAVQGGVSYCQNVTGVTALSATAGSGNTLYWYGTSATGGSGSTAAPVPSVNTPGTFTYYVAQRNAQGCESPRASIQVVVNATPPAPTTNPVTYCQGASATALTATAANSATLSWFTSTTATTGSPTAPIPPTTSAGSTNFYVSQTVNGCESPRATIVVTVSAPPSAPTAQTAVSYCQGVTASALTATASNGATLKWYDSATGSTALGNAPTPSTASAGTTTFYVSQAVGSCESARTAITVTVSAAPAAPAVQAGATYCQNVTGVTALSATASAGNTLYWYGTSATGGSGVTTAPVPPVNTPGTFTYYVAQRSNQGGCESPRASIQVVVNATPAAPAVTAASLCQNAPASALTATASSGATLNWYADASGGTALNGAPTPPTSATGTTNFYVSQTLNGCEGPRATLAVTVRPLPTAPTSTTTSLSFCQNTTVPTLSVTASNGGVLNWYTPGSTAPTTNRPTLSAATTGTQSYSVSQTINGCEGPKITIDVTVLAQPAAPTVSAVAYCQNVTANPLTANATGTINWYGTAQTGGTASGTAPTPPTTTVGNANYYVSQTGSNGCESPRASIVVQVKPTPGAPAVSSAAYCQNQAISPLNASAGAGNTLNWYGTEQTGGTPSGNAPTPSNNTVGTTTYYVSQTQNGCESPRAGIEIRIKPLPGAPGVQDYRLCQFDAAQPVSANGQNLRWFNTDGNAYGSAPTPPTEQGGTYAFQVTQTVEGCESTKATINVTVQTTPAPTVTSPVVYCRGQASTPLSATGTGVSFEWTDPYGNVSATAPVPPTLNVTDGVSYFVTQTGANSCKSPKAEIKFIVNAAPTAALSGSSSVNLGQNAKLTITFTSVPPFSFTLSDGTSGTSDAMTKTIDVLPKESTTYQVTSVSNVCGTGLPAGIANIVVRIPTITTGNLTASTVCAGTSISVPFTTTGEFNNGNIFQVELADTVSKTYVKLAQGVQQSPIVVTIPPNTAQGLYFVRVTASNPSIPVPGKVSSTVLNIRALPTATLTGTRDIYEGESAKLNIQFTGDGPWDFVYADSLRTYPVQTNANPYEITVTPARRTTYRINSVANNCGTGTVSGTAIINVLPVLGVEPNPLVQAVNAYPVPVETTLTVDIAMPLQHEAAKIQLMDANGKSRLQTTTQQQQTVLDLTQQEAGLYFLQIQVGNHTTVRKVLKR